MWARVLNKLRFLFRRGRFDREIAEELDFHRAMLERDQPRDGRDRNLAGAVRRQLGNTTAAQEASRDAWVFTGLDAWLFDARLVIRSLMRAKGFTAAAILTFALGMGVNIAVFTALDRLMFRPLPFAAPDRLVQIHEMTIASSSPSAMLRAEVGAFVQERAQTIDELAYTRGSEGGVSIEGIGGGPVAVAMATANLLPVLGIRPALGRDFTPDVLRARGAPTEILLTHVAWQSRFGASETVVDRVVGTGSRRYRIIGVLPADFVLPSSFLTARTDALTVWRNAFAGPPRRGEIVAAPIARLRAGVTLAQAQAEITTIVASMKSDGPGGRLSVVVQPLQRGLFFLYARYLWLVVTAVGLVLLVACVNLATLLLARGRSRERDLATRAALGASSARLIALSMMESTVLCVLGSALALGVCWWMQAALVALLPPTFRAFAVAGPDLRLIALTLTAALVSAIGAGLVPVLATRHRDLLAVLRRSDRGVASRLRGGATLLAAEAALGVLLVTGAAVTVPSFARLVLSDPGFKPANLFTVDLEHGSQEDGPDATRYTTGRVHDVIEIVRTQPGVAAAAAVTQLPLGESTSSEFWQARGLEGGQWGASRGLFETLGTRITSGRDFTTEDVDEGALVAILNQTGERQLWPGMPRGSAIGRTLTIHDDVYTVIGVVGDIQSAPGVPPRPGLFVPITAGAAPYSQSALVVAVRMFSGQSPDTTLLGSRLAARFPARPISLHGIVDDLVEPRLQRPRFLALLFGALAAISLVLAAVGVSAVANCELSRRRYEIAVRVALGASRADIRGLVFARLVRPVAAGAVIGAVLAWWAAGLVQALVFEVDARAPWTLTLVMLTIVMTSVAAGWAPARRAATTDPTTVLRES